MKCSQNCEPNFIHTNIKYDLKWKRKMTFFCWIVRLSTPLTGKFDVSSTSIQAKNGMNDFEKVGSEIWKLIWGIEKYSKCYCDNSLLRTICTNMRFEYSGKRIDNYMNIKTAGEILLCSPGSIHSDAHDIQ